MVLNSLSFALFFLIFLGILLVLPGKARKPWLFLGNCLYYFSWERRAFLLLLLSAWMIWACGMAMERYTKKKPFLVIPVVWNVLLLLVFRYAGLLDGLFHPAGEPGLISFSRLAAPVGISFYTLRCISYMADVYRGTIPAEKSFLNVFLYVSFFPQIISGPIERPGNFFRELSAFETVPLRNFERIRRGFLLFVWGLFQKIVIAERLAVAASTVLSDFTAFGFWELLIGTAAYLLQVYCDFAGYSDMSRGISAMMGFSTMRNFRQPFLAPGIRSLWRRWHIGLTSWLTDYVYIPLGGSRKGLLRKYLNITAAFLLSGLWHGSTLNYAFWGLLNAGFQILEDQGERRGLRMPGVLGRIITLAEMHFSSIFFGAGGLMRGFRIVRQMFTHFALPDSWSFGLVPGNWAVLLAGLVILLIVDMLHEQGVGILDRTASLPLPLRWALMHGLFWAVIMLGIYGVGYDTSGFIYTQF